MKCLTEEKIEACTDLGECIKNTVKDGIVKKLVNGIGEDMDRFTETLSDERKFNKEIRRIGK